VREREREWACVFKSVSILNQTSTHSMHLVTRELSHACAHIHPQEQERADAEAARAEEELRLRREEEHRKAEEQRREARERKRLEDEERERRQQEEEAKALEKARKERIARESLSVCACAHAFISLTHACMHVLSFQCRGSVCV
jgi:hypothetical protein